MKINKSKHLLILELFGISSLLLGGIIVTNSTVFDNFQIVANASDITTIDSGTIGEKACKWELDSEGTLHIHAGTITGDNFYGQAWNKPELQGKIKKIMFDDHLKYNEFINNGGEDVDDYSLYMASLTNVEGKASGLLINASNDLYRSIDKNDNGFYDDDYTFDDKVFFSDDPNSSTVNTYIKLPDSDPKQISSQKIPSNYKYKTNAPVQYGYVQNETPSNASGTALETANDINVVYKFSPVGSLYINNKKISSYQNDPTDATKVMPIDVNIPRVKTSFYDQNGNKVNGPIIPSDPTKDTKLTSKDQTSKARINLVPVSVTQGSVYNPSVSFISGQDADGNNINFNNSGISYRIIDSKGKDINSTDLTKTPGIYAIAVSLKYGNEVTDVITQTNAIVVNPANKAEKVPTTSVNKKIVKTSTKYYTKSPKIITVLNKNGINGYKHGNLVDTVAKQYRQGDKISIKSISKVGQIYRFNLKNGTYVTANRAYVASGKVKFATKIKAKGKVTVYSNANVTKVKKRYSLKARPTFKVSKVFYTNGNHKKKVYKVNGGYIVANTKQLKIIATR